MDGQIVSQYRILGKIAEGAQGTVYEALHERMGRRVALKFLNEEALLDPADRRRFDREAKIASRLDHSSICAIYDYDEADGRVFLAMPFLDGSTLRALLQEGPLPLADALLIAIQVAEGLQEAHAQGIIHRDIKPSNIMITGAAAGRPQAKILDFGLARSQDMTAVTRTGTTVGTAAYMSPEQVQGKPLDGRTDIWSFGAVLYEMVTGQRAFPGENPQAVLYGILHVRPVPAGSLRPESRPELRRIIGKTLERAPQDRYRDAEELLADLRALLREMQTPRGPARDWFWKYRNRIALIGAGLVGLAIVVFGVLGALTRLPERTVPLGQPRQVTFGEEWEGEPALSPDGSRLAFSRFNGADYDIFWVGVKGGEPVPIAPHPADERCPQWLPDGSGLIFTSDRTGLAGIWKADLSGTEAMLLVAGARDPGLSADGRLLAFTQTDSTGQYRVFVTSLQDPETRYSVSGDVHGVWSHFSPSFSPDGTSLCFTDYHNIWQVGLDNGGLDGGAANKLTTGGTWDSHPVWSNDGRHIYFSSLRDGTSALWRVAVTGGTPMRLTPGSGPERNPSLDRSGLWLAYSTEKDEMNVLLVDRRGSTVPVTTGWTLCQQAALAPDASFMVYLARRQEGTYSLWRRELVDGVPADTEMRLTDQPGSVSHPAVSNDGRWIAYYVIDPRDGNREIWTVPARGGRPIRVTDSPATDSAPAWAPDGLRLAFCSERAGLSAIFTVAIQEGRPVGDPMRVSPTGMAANYPCWSPQGNRIAFLASRDTDFGVFVAPAAGPGEPVQLTSGADIHLIRWVSGLDEIWASAAWGDGGISVRRIDPSGGGTAPLQPPLRIPAGSEFGWFGTDTRGRYAVLTEIHRAGDIWVIEAKEGQRF